MDLGLQGRKAILVGANQGLGLAAARIFASEGVSIALCARSQPNIDKAVTELQSWGGTVIGGSVDVTDAKAHVAWLNQAVETLGGCDIFISFASVNPGQDTEQAWRTVVDVDILPLSRGVQTVTPALERSDCGSIVTISSTAAFEDFMGPQPYNALKAGVINYSAALAQKFAPSGIRVNCISPGPTQVAGGPWDAIEEGAPDFYNGIKNQIPMGRMGTGDEIGRAIAFVASPACRFMTGANLVIDGGLTKRVQF